MDESNHQSSSVPPKNVRTVLQHPLPLEQHPQAQAVEFIYRTLQQNGYKMVLAGGAVRDWLLGGTPKDIDLVTDARPEQIEALFEQTVPIGKSFGVILVGVDGFSFEIATFRSEYGYDDGRHPTSVTWGTPEQDAHRRDFTVNGLFYEPGLHEIWDYVGGLQDLKSHLLRTIGLAEDRFQEDHLRILRAYRFRAQLGFEWDENLSAVVSQKTHLLAHVSRERIRDEWLRLMAGRYRSKVIPDLVAHGILDLLFSPLPLSSNSSLSLSSPPPSSSCSSSRSRSSSRSILSLSSSPPPPKSSVMTPSALWRLEDYEPWETPHEEQALLEFCRWFWITELNSTQTQAFHSRADSRPHTLSHTLSQPQSQHQAELQLSRQLQTSQSTSTGPTSPQKEFLDSLRLSRKQVSTVRSALSLWQSKGLLAPVGEWVEQLWNPDFRCGFLEFSRDLQSPAKRELIKKISSKLDSTELQGKINLAWKRFQDWGGATSPKPQPWVNAKSLEKIEISELQGKVLGRALREGYRAQLLMECRDQSEVIRWIQERLSLLQTPDE